MRAFVSVTVPLQCNDVAMIYRVTIVLFMEDNLSNLVLQSSALEQIEQHKEAISRRYGSFSATAHGNCIVIY